MASDLANTNMDIPPVTSAPLALSSASGLYSHVLPGSSFGPGLSVETLTASNVNAIRPLLTTVNVNQSVVSSPPAASHTDTSNLSLSVSNSLAAVSSAQLPASVIVVFTQ